MTKLIKCWLLLHFPPLEGRKHLTWVKFQDRGKAGSWDVEWVLCCSLGTPESWLENASSPIGDLFSHLFLSGAAFADATKLLLFSQCVAQGSGSDGRLPASHQTFSQSFSSTGQPRGPLEPPQIIKPWSLSCLRPAPPLRPSAALGYKEVILLHMV